MRGCGHRGRPSGAEQGRELCSLLSNWLNFKRLWQERRNYRARGAREWRRIEAEKRRGRAGFLWSSKLLVLLADAPIPAVSAAHQPATLPWLLMFVPTSANIYALFKPEHNDNDWMCAGVMGRVLFMRTRWVFSGLLLGVCSKCCWATAVSARAMSQWLVLASVEMPPNGAYACTPTNNTLLNSLRIL